MRMGPTDLYKMLPKTNCGDCGHPLVWAFPPRSWDMASLTFVAEKLAKNLISIEKEELNV